MPDPIPTDVDPRINLKLAVHGLSLYVKVIFPVNKYLVSVDGGVTVIAKFGTVIQLIPGEYGPILVFIMDWKIVPVTPTGIGCHVPFPTNA